ncbi:hypothetical protein VXE65_20155 [Mycolicibacterium conceptionense]|uniref:hypothetical protein n=1 Tax=Mycolicibacterium conceptionense TaxID=451644 RepID=UPI003204AC49
MTPNHNQIHTPPQDPQNAAATYKATYQAARDLGYTELEAMAYANEPDLFAANHPDEYDIPGQAPQPPDATRHPKAGTEQ